MTEIISAILTNIVNPVVTVLFVLAVVYFLWGIFKFVSNDEGGTEREEGKKSMMWGIIGLFIMISVWGIIGFIKTTIDVV